MAKAATTEQARLWGQAPTDVPAPASHETPSEAVAALVERSGVTLSPEQAASIAALDELPEPTRDALTRTVDAFVAFDVATQRAFQDADSTLLWTLASPSPEPLPGGTQAVQEAIDLSPTLEARNHLLDALADLHAALETTPTTLDEGPVEVPPAVVVDLDGGQDTYTEDVALLIDDGGSDVYHNNAGGSRVVQTGQALPPHAGAAALIDLGGHDTYGDGVASGGVNGAGMWGSGFVADVDGDDVFDARRWSNGGGVFGSGFILNVGGNDDYDAASVGTNGGGRGGTGLLVDTSGHDTYTASGFGTNGGGSYGVGTLVDLAGDDSYSATIFGVNGGAAADDKPVSQLTGVDYPALPTSGAGLLLDGGGTDTYEDDETGDRDGSGEDRTVLPKGLTGAQVDLDG